MKIVYLILISIIVSAIVPKNNTMLKNYRKTEHFKQKTNYNLSNWIEFTYSGYSIYGVFYGVELLNKDTRVYYKSNLDELIVIEDRVSFKLNNYKFKATGFNIKEPNTQYSKQISNIPDILKFPQNFSGIRRSDSLYLKRTSILYDSAFDEFVFVKVWE